MEKLYQLAFAFKKAKLWKKLTEEHMFAVPLPDGETGYCSVMGMLGEHFALAVYHGLSGLRGYCMLNEGTDDLNVFHVTERAFSLDCVMCSFENKDMLHEDEINAVRSYCSANKILLRGPHAWPQFHRCCPDHPPCTLQEETEKEWMITGLEAALEVARRLEKESAGAVGLKNGSVPGREIPLLVKTEAGYDWQTIVLPDHVEQNYPEAGPLYDLLVKKVSMKRQRAGIWACGIFRLPRPVQHVEVENEDGSTVPADASEEPFYPWVQVVCDVESGALLDTVYSTAADDYAELFPNKLLELMAAKGKPRRMLVETERVETLYRGFAKQMGVPLERVVMCGELEDLLEEIFNDSAEDDEFDEDEQFFLDEMAEMLGGMLFGGGGPFGFDRGALSGFAGKTSDALIDLFQSSGDFTEVPDALLFSLYNLSKMMGPNLPDKYRRRLEKEMERRLT